MKNIRLLSLEKHQNTDNYKLIEDGIYQDLNDSGFGGAYYRVALSFELEEGEDTQYPLEDLLDAYRMHVADFLASDSPSVLNLELGGTLKYVQQGRTLPGKRVYNTNFTGENGKAYIKLIIE